MNVSNTSNLDNASAAHHENVTLRNKRRNPHCDCLTADTIREVIREELDRKFNNEIQEIYQRLDKFQECLALSNSERDKLNSDNESCKTQIDKLQQENSELRASSRDLSRRLQQLEQLSRSNNIEIQCIPENKNENLVKTVQQLGNIIKCTINDSDIEYCSRIAKLNTQSPRPRSVLVKFGSRRLRDTFLASAIKFNRNNPTDKINSSHLGYGGNKKSAVFVTEHLTPESKSLHAAARLKARELKYRFVWVRDGKVFMRKTENSNYILLRDLGDLNKLS